MQIRAAALQSGSNGNSIYVEAGGAKLIFDAGISPAMAAKRLASLGRDIKDVDAVIISHDHSDHVKFAGSYQKKCGLPVYISMLTLATACETVKFNPEGVVHFFPGAAFGIRGAVIRTVPTPHDSADGAAFVISHGGKSMGIFTDLGHVFSQLEENLELLDAVFIESNYDPSMLAKGPYPPFLKKRISGPRGHISNHESARLVKDAKKLRWACLAHLSETNNTPALALRTHRELGVKIPLVAASRYQASGLMEV
ncbi:MAG: MBL fold metallo-hydrolase [Actinomycetota bacterium]|nr:MBL fold metallo-hydrolase [Actinomycetota bacterium]